MTNESSTRFFPFNRALQVPIGPPGLTYRPSLPSSGILLVFSWPSITLVTRIADSVWLTCNVHTFPLNAPLLPVRVYEPEKSGLLALTVVGDTASKAAKNVTKIEQTNLFTIEYTVGSKSILSDLIGLLRSHIGD